MCYLGFPANAPAPPEAVSPPADKQEVKERTPAPYSDEFFMFHFKVVECDNLEHTRDDWDTCPFAHVGEVVTRRPPHTHLPKLCPKARRACRKGRACPYAHNVFEHWLHPSRFKTEICQHGSSCNRPMCFFAHYPHEIRHPSPSADEVMAAAEAAGLLGRPNHGASGRCCAARNCGGSCFGAASMYTSSASGSSRRSSSTNHDAGTFAMARPVWLGAQAAALQTQFQMPAAQAQLYDTLNMDLALAAQCLQAQQVQQQQNAALAAAAAAAATAGWSSGEWALLSSGDSSPHLLPTPRDTSPTALLGAAAQYGAAAGPAVSTALGGGGFDLWSLGAPAGPAPGLAPPMSVAAAGAVASASASGQTLSTEDALLLLAGLPQARGAAPNPYLCALQAEQARLASIASFF